MGTINQLESKLRLYKLALIEAFGLDPDTTSGSVSVDPDSITFTCLSPVQDLQARLLVDEAKLSGVLSSDRPPATTVEVMAHHWNEAQRQAVETYIELFRFPRFILKGDPDVMRQALAAPGGNNQLMVLPSGAELEIHPLVAPEPTWRDVFRAMHNAGYKLKFEERDGDYRKWIVPVGTMGEVASIIRETLGGKPCWSVEIYGYLMYSVRLHNPPPADVLAAAKLVKLIAETEVQA